MSRLRKVKMDQRKLMDNANTITDMAKVNQLENLCSVQQFMLPLFFILFSCSFMCIKLTLALDEWVTECNIEDFALMNEQTKTTRTTILILFKDTQTKINSVTNNFENKN